MQVTIFPSRAAGTITAPPSKSMAHRLLISAGLAHGQGVVHGIASSEDVLATLDCLRALGAEAAYHGGTVRVTGIGGRAAFAPATLPCRECGSTLRFFIPLALATGAEMRMTGSERLFARNLSVYEAIAAEQGLGYRQDATGLTLRGPLKSGTFRVRGDISSQFISGLLFALPLLSGDSRIAMTTRVESRPYIDLTLSALRTFGIQADWVGEDTILVPGGQQYRPVEATVEGDYSNAAFFAVYNTLGGDVQVEGLDPHSLQGDRVYQQHFPALVAGHPTIDLSDCPDLGPILMAAAACHHGALFTGTRRLRIKESDRVAAMAEELKKFGICMDVAEDTAEVYGGSLLPPAEPLCGHNDHRIVMALSTLLTLTGGTVTGAEAVKKSLPDYFDRLLSLGVQMERGE